MGFLGNSKERGRLAKMRQELKAQPRPHGLAELARKHLAFGDLVGAEEVVAFGESLFPTSDDIRRVRSILLSEASESSLREAKEAAKDDPSAATWLALADRLHVVGRVDQSMMTLREILDRFGDYVPALNRLARVRLDRYRVSKASSDGYAAWSYMTRAVGADADDLTSRQMIAEIYFLVGGWGLASVEVDAILDRSAEDPIGLELRQAIATKPRDGSYEDFESLLSTAEVSRNLFELPWDGKDDDDEEEEMAPLTDPRVEIARLLERNGLTRVALASGEHRWGVGSRYEDLATRTVAVVQSFERAARGMELGLPTGVIVECADGSFIVECKQGATLGMVTSATSKLGSIAVDARDALERVVRS